jgi:hypothetical protein
MHFNMRFKEISTFEAFTAQLALVMFRILNLGLFGVNEHLFVGETPQHHFQFPPCLDASAQVLLHRGHGGKLLSAYLAPAISVIWSPVSSESGNLIRYALLVAIYSSFFKINRYC